MPLAPIGDPHRGLRCIHIAGSKGKGSTALLCEAILGAAGLRLGTCTSPHLQRWSERFRVGGREVDDTDPGVAAERLRAQLAALLGAAHPPGFFDFLTATAFALFEQARVGVAVIEVGLGGRLDATNVIQPRVSCITSIELEHTERLGMTHAAIASERAGVIKAGIPVVIGTRPAEALAAVKATAADCAAPTHRLGREFDAHLASASADGLKLCIRSGALALDLAMLVLGPHLAGNAALALACVQHSRLWPPRRIADAARADSPAGHCRGAPKSSGAARGSSPTGPAPSHRRAP